MFSLRQVAPKRNTLSKTYFYKIIVATYKIGSLKIKECLNWPKILVLSDQTILASTDSSFFQLFVVFKQKLCSMSSSLVVTPTSTTTATATSATLLPFKFECSNARLHRACPSLRILCHLNRLIFSGFEFRSPKNDRDILLRSF